MREKILAAARFALFPVRVGTNGFGFGVVPKLTGLNVADDPVLCGNICCWNPVC